MWLSRLSPAWITAAVAVAVFALAFNSGSYAPTVRAEIAIGALWAVGLGAVVALWPRVRVPRAAMVSGGLLGALALLSVLSTAWSDSAENAFAEADRIVLYLGVFALVVAVTRRGSARRWADGLAVGITAVGLIALGSRLLPGLIHSPDLSKLFNNNTYLSYPLEYWNGLAAFVALAFPLLLRIATSARRTWVRGLAVAPLPALSAAVYLTSSRGGALTAALGVALFVALTNRRGAAVWALVVGAVGSVAAVLVLSDRHQLVNGPFGTHAVSSQGRSATLLILLICALTGAAFAAGTGVPMTQRRPGRRAGRLLLAACAVLLVGALVAAHPVQRWNNFTKPPPNIATQQQSGDLGTGSHLLSGASNGRYQFWSAAVSEFEHHPLIGGGAGSYQVWWQQHGTISYFTRNAHSLYLETLGELGILGFALIVALVLSAVPPVRRRWRAARGEDRRTIAALASVFAAFAFAAGIDWMWQLTVVSIVGVATLALLTGPATQVAAAEPAAGEPPADAPAETPAPAPAARRRRRGLRIAVAVAALALIVAEGIPYLAQTKIRDSQHAAFTGNTQAALNDARRAQSLEPWASSPYLQSALVREGAGDLRGARAAIAHAIRNSPTDYSLWLVASRIASESGNPALAGAERARARELNPKSELFASNAAGGGAGTSPAGSAS